MAEVTLKTCRVSCVDLRGIEHAVEMSANSLYEAVAQALGIFRDHKWIEGIGHSQTPLKVKVKQSEAEHAVRVQDSVRWLETTPRSPAEMTFKTRLRELLGQAL